MIVKCGDKKYTSQTFYAGGTTPKHVYLRYGLASDCYCGSVLGYFIIDTTTTGMIVDPTVRDTLATSGYICHSKNVIREAMFQRYFRYKNNLIPSYTD